MHTATINQIDELLKNSGLFPEKGIPAQKISNFNFVNETILITGAAGSIGSALSKQLSKLSPSHNPHIVEQHQSKSSQLRTSKMLTLYITRFIATWSTPISSISITHFIKHIA